MEIVWTKLAKITFIEVIENLENRWTIKELIIFKKLTMDLSEKVSSKQVEHLLVNEKLGVRKGLIHKNVSVFYKIDMSSHKIYLVTFFHNRMNPDTLDALLKNTNLIAAARKD